MSELPLRDRQVELTRRLILDALGTLIGEGRLGDFSVQDVADRAGVSLRTVYRHFASRHALLEGFAAYADEQLNLSGGIDPPATADDVAAYVRLKVATLERFASLVSPILKLDIATGLDREMASKNAAELHAALSEVTDGLEPALGEAVIWVLRMICSSQTWLAMHERGNLDARHAGAAAAWAVELLVEALREGRSPRLEGEARQ